MKPCSALHRLPLRLLLAASLALPVLATAQELKVEERFLSNGMRLLLVPRPDEPTIAGGWVAHVGSVNERPGITGISHFFEHMMFKGTPTIGTKDYKKDVEIMEAQERVREEMRAEEAKMRRALRAGEIDDIAKPENKTARYRELEQQFDGLVKEQRNLIVKNEFDRIYTRSGASGMNASTWNDLTNYFITVPKNRLETWMWMESDRLRNPVFREFYAERDVVFEERRLRLESTPTGKLDEAFDAKFWHSHPYSWSVIGYPSDLPAYTKAQADEYYSLYYSPNNITAILVGDFDPKEALALAERYFGRIPRGPKDPPEMTTLPPKWGGELRFLAEADANPQVTVRCHTVPFRHKDSYALQTLAQILNGRTGRLHKGLILGANAVATEANAQQESRKYAGAFEISAQLKDGRTLEELEKAVNAEVERLKTELVPPEELQKVKNNSAAAAYRRLSTNSAILFQMTLLDGWGDWREINEGPKRLQAVTAEDVRRVAQTYLRKENRGVALYSRKASEAGAKGGATEDEIAALPDFMRPVMRKQIAEVVGITDAEALKQRIAKMESQAGSVSPELRAGFDLLLKKAKDRLAEVTAPAPKPAK